MGSLRDAAGLAAKALGGVLSLLGMTGIASAQGFNPPNSGQQPGFSPYATQFVPSIVGAWTAQRPSQFGPAQQTDAFSQDGRFVSVILSQTTGLLVRAWGSYRANPAGPNQLRLDIALQDFLPKEVCGQSPGTEMICRPFGPLPQTDTVLVTFTSPSSFQAVSQSNQSAGPVIATRELNPVLLQRQVAPQQVINLPALPQPSQATPAYPYTPATPSAPAYSSSTLSRCSDLQARTSCVIAGGRLVVSDGCLVCLP